MNLGIFQPWNEYCLALNLKGINEDYFKGIMILVAWFPNDNIYKFNDFKALWFQIYYLILFFKLSFGCPNFPYLATEWEAIAYTSLFINLSIIFNNLWYSSLNLSTACHPQTVGQTGRVNQILKDFFHAYVLDSGRSWKDHLHIVKLTYSNSYQV